MFSIIVLVCMLLPALGGGRTVQQDTFCTDSYAEFESASVGSNISGADIRNQLYKAFYTPNQYLPYSILITYQLVLANGTKVNLSSSEHCTESWMWLSSPVFLLEDATYLNYLLLFSLNYFVQWNPPHVTITTTTAPCPDKMRDFLSEMTASLQDYALGQMDYKTSLGYVKRGCGTSALDIRSSLFGLARALTIVIAAMTVSGIFLQVVFVWIVSAVLLKIGFKTYAQKTFTYSYDVYGIFWGISTTAVGLLGILYGVYTANHKNHGWPTLYALHGVLFSPLVVELPVAIYIVSSKKVTVAVPCIFRYPATLLCCGRKNRADQLVTMNALWVDLVVLQQILLQGVLTVFAISAAPFAKNPKKTPLPPLALSCFSNFLSLLYTIFAHLCTPSNQRVHSSSIVLRAIVVLPLLLMIICYGVVVGTMGSVTNVDAKRNNILSFINSIITPMLLGLVSIFLKKLISAWLNWSPQETEQATDDTRRQELNEELLSP